MYRKGQAGLPTDFATARDYLFKAAAQKPYLRIQVLSGALQHNLGVAEAENRYSSEPWGYAFPFSLEYGQCGASSLSQGAWDTPTCEDEYGNQPPTTGDVTNVWYFIK